MHTKNICLVEPETIINNLVSLPQEVRTSVNAALLRSRLDLKFNEEILICKMTLAEATYLFPLIKNRNRIRMVKHLSYNFLICDKVGFVRAKTNVVASILEWCKTNGYDYDLRFNTVSELLLDNYNDTYVRKICWPVLQVGDVNYLKALKKNKRYDLRKARTLGYHHQFGREDLLNDFYSVYTDNMVDIGVPPQEKSFFQNFLKNFGDKATLVVCYSSETVIAAGVLLNDENAELCYAASNKRFKLANYFMYDVIFKRCQNSNSLFCHGRADEASSGLKFKSRLSSEIGLVYWISNKPYSRESRMLTFILKKATKLAYHLGVLNWLTLIHRFIN